jgi:hypothetical protein
VTVTATHQTAETRFVDAGGVRFAFFGAPGGEPEQVAARVNAFLASPATAS